MKLEIDTHQDMTEMELRTLGQVLLEKLEQYWYGRLGPAPKRANTILETKTGIETEEQKEEYVKKNPQYKDWVEKEWKIYNDSQERYDKLQAEHLAKWKAIGERLDTVREMMLMEVEKDG